MGGGASINDSNESTNDNYASTNDNYASISDNNESIRNNINSTSNTSTTNNTSRPTAVSRFQSPTPLSSPFWSWKSEEALLLLYVNNTVQCHLLQHRPPSSLQEPSLSHRSISLPLQLDSPDVSTVFAQMTGNSRIRITLLTGSLLTTVDAARSDTLRQTAMRSQRIGNDCGLKRIMESPRSVDDYIIIDDRNRLLFWSEHVWHRIVFHL